MKTLKSKPRRPTAKTSDKALRVAVETLALYANPESYHAIWLVCDHPCGWFEEDVSKTDHPHYSRKMHGAAAREALAKIQKLMTPKENNE